MKQLTLILILALLVSACNKDETSIPYWLSDHSEIYKEDPVEASRLWFQEAKMGMFVHFNICSILENGSPDYKKWIGGTADESILEYVGVSMEEYQNAESLDSLLFTRFEIPEFDPDKICQLAIKAKMKYIVFTAHHFSCNFDAEHITLNSVNASPDGRDLVAEMTAACKKYKLAPFFYMRSEYKKVRTKDKERNLATLKELLTEYGPIAGLWFDDSVNKYSEDNEGMDEINYFIKELQPHCLVSFKHGQYSCSEDYISPEYYMLPFDYEMPTEGQRERLASRKVRFEKYLREQWEKCSKYKLREISTSMMESKWRDLDTEHLGWMNAESARRLSGEEAYFWLTYARYTGSNLLMNIGPRADGSVHPEAEKGLIELGKIIDDKGWPELVHRVPEKAGESN